MMSLEYHWVGSRIKVLFDLWKILFYGDDLKIDNEEQLKNAIYERVYAFKAVRKFVEHCRKLQTDNILKVIGSFICSYANQLYTVFQKGAENAVLKKNSNELLSAKLELYRTTNNISSQYYAPKFNLILQNALEDVANHLSEEMFLLISEVFPYREFDIGKVLRLRVALSK